MFYFITHIVRYLLTENIEEKYVTTPNTDISALIRRTHTDTGHTHSRNELYMTNAILRTIGNRD